MSTTSYLFYDIETTGLNKCFDQVIQFAAIRTDLKLKELERHEIQVKLNPEVIPSPEAILTHRIGIKAMQSGDSEIAALKKIHQLLNQPGTISIGYNSLGFDDEFLRFGFYRNLLPPYTHQYANQCSRMDIYPIATLYYLYQPDCIQWPIINDKISLKLDAINQANQLVSGQAHNAMVDVEATLELARKFHKEHKMWEYATGYFKKNTDLERLQELPFSLKIGDYDFQESLMINSIFGARANFQAPVIGLGQHHHYRNQTLWLRLDNENLTKTTPETIAENTSVVKKRAAEQQLLLPPKERFLKHLDAERKVLADKNRVWLQENSKLMQKIIAYHLDFKYPVNPNTDAQAALYEVGFPPPYEEKLYREFHAAKPEKKADLAQRFADNTRRELAARLLARFYPQHCPADLLEFYTHYCEKICSDHPPEDYRREAQLTPIKALERITKLEATELDNEQHNLLNELKNYLQLNFKICSITGV